MAINCPRCGAETTSGVYCQACTDLLQAELEAADVLNFAMQWCIEYFKVQAGLQPHVRTHLAELPPEDATVYEVKVFVPEPASNVLMSIGEEADEYTVIRWTIAQA